MVYGPITSKPQDRTTVRNRVIADKAKFTPAQSSGWDSLAKAFSDFAGNMRVEEEKMELIEDQKALDQYYLNIRNNPEALAHASRTGNWGEAFPDITARSHRPAVLKMMPLIAGRAMGTEIARSAIEAIQDLGPTDDPQEFLDSFLAKELQGIQDATIERSVYDTVTKATLEAVAQHKQVMVDHHNLKQTFQVRSFNQEQIKNGVPMSQLLEDIKLHAAGLEGNYAKNLKTLQAQLFSQIIWLSEASDDEATRQSAIALLTQESDELGGNLLNALDPVKRDKLQREARELSKSRDKAKLMPLYKNLTGAVAYASNSTEAMAYFNEAVAQAIKIGGSKNDAEVIAAYKAIQQRIKAEQTALKATKGHKVSPKEASDAIEAQIYQLSLGRPFDPHAFVNSAALTHGQLSREAKGSIANFLIGENHKGGLALFQALTAASTNSLTFAYEVDITQLLPKDSPVLPQIAWMLNQPIKTVEDFKKAKLDWEAQMGSSFSRYGVSPINAARKLYDESGKNWMENDENVVDVFLSDNREALAKHWDIDESRLKDPSLLVRNYIERRLNYAAAGTASIQGLTKEQFATTAMKFMGNPILVQEMTSDGMLQDSLSIPGTAVGKDGVRRIAKTPEINREHLRNIVGSNIGARYPEGANPDGSVILTARDGAGNDNPINILPGEPFQVNPELAKQFSRANFNVTKTDDGAFVVDALPDSDEGEVEDINGVLYLKHVGDGWQIRARTAYLSQLPENEGWFLKLARATGMVPKTGVVTEKTLRERIEAANIRGNFAETVANVYRQRGDFHESSVEERLINLVDDLTFSMNNAGRDDLPDTDKQGRLAHLENQPDIHGEIANRDRREDNLAIVRRMQKRGYFTPKPVEPNPNNDDPAQDVETAPFEDWSTVQSRKDKLALLQRMKERGVFTSKQAKIIQDDLLEPVEARPNKESREDRLALLQRLKEMGVFTSEEAKVVQDDLLEPVEARPNALQLVQQLLTMIDEEITKDLPSDGTLGVNTGEKSIVDEQIDNQVIYDSVVAEVDSGRAHPNALQLVQQYGEDAITIANKENNFIPYKNQIAMSALNNITSLNPPIDYKSPGTATHIGATQASKGHNPMVLTDDTGTPVKFESPTQGIAKAQSDFTTKWTNGATSVRTLLSSSKPVSSLTAPIADKHLSSSARAELRDQGKTTISLDSNSIGKPHTFAPMVVIPDDASPEIRKQAEAWVSQVTELVNEKTGNKFKGRVVTRSQNKRGRKNTVHLEPFGVNDTTQIEGMDATAYWSKGPGMKMMAEIMHNTFGSSNEAILTSPHGNGDPGAVGPHGSEVDLASGILEELGATMVERIDAPENHTAIVARHVGLNPDEFVDLRKPEVLIKFLQGVIEARQGTEEGLTWKPYVREVVEGREANLPSTGTGDTVTGHGYRFDWPMSESEMKGAGVSDLKKITPEQHRLLAATRINSIMSQYAEWIPNTDMDNRKRQALTEYLYYSPWNENTNRPAFLTQKMITNIREEKWNRVAREIQRETRVFKQGLNRPQKTAARFLTKMQRQVLADKFTR